MLDTSDLPVIVLPSLWSTNHQIYRIGQCTSHDGFLPWSIIKASLGLSKQGRTPTWVSWLTSTYNHPLTQTSDMPTTCSMVPTTDRRRKEWGSFLSDDNTVLVGKISSKSLSANRIFISHWTHNSRPFFYNLCNGCSNTSWLTSDETCIIQRQRSQL